MAQAAGNLRSLMRMARLLRQAAKETCQPSYSEKFNRAAAELEHRARCLAGLHESAEAESDDDDDTRHAPVDTPV